MKLSRDHLSYVQPEGYAGHLHKMKHVRSFSVIKKPQEKIVFLA